MKQNNEAKFKLFKFDFTLYNVFASLVAIIFTGILVYSVAFLPLFGDVNAPTNNEVPIEYVENGMENTSAVNIVAAVILDYRAFDTFGEACMLYTATIGVIALLRIKSSTKLEEEGEDE